MKTVRFLLLAAFLPCLAMAQSAPAVGGAVHATPIAGASTSTANTFTAAQTFGANGTPITSIRMGTTAALVGGTAVVTDAGATASTRYFFTTHTLGTITVPSAYYASARSVGVSFTITSNQATDTSTVDWIAFN